jgi:hypothetical protein
MRGVTYGANTRTTPRFVQDDLNREHVLPGGSKVDAAAIAADSFGKKSIPAGTLLGRTYAERAANTPFGLAADADDEVFLVAYDVLDAADINDVDLLRPGTLILENFLPASFAALSATLKGKVRALYQTTLGAE